MKPASTACTRSTEHARYAVRRALSGEQAILHLVTDDFCQFVSIMETACFDRMTHEQCTDAYEPGEPSQLYIDLDSLSNDEWQEQLLGVQKESRTPLPMRVFYATPTRQDTLSDRALNCMRSYLARWSLARQKHPDERALWPRCCMVILGRKIALPPFWEQNVARIEPEPLQTEDFARLMAPYGANPDQALVEWYARHLASFSEQSVRSILSSIAYGPDPQKNLEDVTAAECIIRQEKNAILRQHNKLEYLKPRDPGTGLPLVRAWLEKHRANILRTDHTGSEDLTKGFILVGPPGTGKSMISGAAAAILGLPLLRLNMSSILGKYVSESETNMQQVLDDLRTCGAPCVLQIEEIERALAGAGSDSNGVMDRLIGQLLTFLQELDQPVFIIPTGNDISGLPDSLTRNGRFSCIISVMLPSYEECVDIMHYHLKRHIGSADRELAAELFRLCTGTPEHPRFLNAADIVEASNSMCIELGLLPGRGSSQFTWAATAEGQERQRARLRQAMTTAAARIRTLVNCRQQGTVRRIAESYCSILEMGTISGNSHTSLICSENYNSAQVKRDGNAKPDGSKMPECLTAPKDFDAYPEYDKRMFRWIGQYMDEYLRTHNA